MCRGTISAACGLLKQDNSYEQQQGLGTDPVQTADAMQLGIRQKQWYACGCYAGGLLFDPCIAISPASVAPSSGVSQAPKQT